MELLQSCAKPSKYNNVQESRGCLYLISLPEADRRPPYYIGMDDEGIVDVDEECQLLLTTAAGHLEADQLPRQVNIQRELTAAGDTGVVHSLKNKARITSVSARKAALD